MLNRSRVTAGFVKTVVSTPPENKRCKKKRTKKWKECSIFRSMGNVKPCPHLNEAVNEVR